MTTTQPRPTQAYCPRCNAHLFRAGAAIEDDGYLKCAACGWQLQVAGVQTCSRCDRLLFKGGRCRECDSADGFDFSGTMKTVALVGLPLVAIGLAVSFLPKVHLPKKKTSAHHMSIQDAEALGRRYKAQQDAQIAAYRQKAELEAQRQAEQPIMAQEPPQTVARVQTTDGRHPWINPVTGENNLGEELNQNSSSQQDDQSQNPQQDQLQADLDKYRTMYNDPRRFYIPPVGPLLREIINLAKNVGNRPVELAASQALFDLTTQNKLDPL